MHSTLSAAPWLLMLLALPALAAEPEPIQLWPNRPPGTAEGATPQEPVIERAEGRVRVTQIDRATITVHHPDEANRTGATVIVCPGGGYEFLSLDNEGDPVVDWLNDLGVTAVLLKYRVPRAEHITHWQPPLMDAQRAISYVRDHAEQWQLDPGRIGILGFSAGGHLSALASTHFDARAYEPIDAIDEISCRPDFAILIYPAYMTVDGEGEKLSSEIDVTDATPPAVMFHAANDPYTPLGSVRYFETLRAHNIAAGLHVFRNGGHGFGMGQPDMPPGAWPDLAANWLRSMNILPNQPAGLN